MSTLALNKLLEYILSLSLSNSNKGWLAEKIIMSKTEETFQEMVFGSNQDSLEITGHHKANYIIDHTLDITLKKVLLEET